MLKLNGGTRVLCLSIWAFAVFSLGALTARADTATFAIEPQDLSGALKAFAVQSRREIFFAPELVRGRKSQGVKGQFDDLKALNIILEGTGLDFSVTASNAILVRDPSSKDQSPQTGAPSTTKLGNQESASPKAVQSTVSQDQNVETAKVAHSKSKEVEDQALDEIIVTGTNIRGVENRTVPLLIFDRDAIERSGYATTEDFIGSLPQNVKSAGNSADGVLTGQGLNNIENSTAANLRGLGASSTLTLINGHRVAPAAYGSGVDLSMIPLSAVERIEVLTDGSSAIYGSDAVGGVVNIILRKDFNGAESSARFDTLSQGGGEQKQVGQSLGRTWNSGGALLVLQFDDANAIHADQRGFTSNLPEPTDIYPSSKRYSGVFSGHQSLTESLEVFTDALAEHNDGFRTFTSGGFFSRVQQLTNPTDSVSANAGVRWQPFGDWHLEGNTLFSQVDTLSTAQYSPPEAGYTNGAPYLRNLETIKEADLKLDGTLWTSGGSSIKGAAGASYRREDFSSLVEYTDTDRPLNRRVSAVFAEVYAPVISGANAITLVKKLEFSAAVRKDSYSDFGAKTNPRLGVFWSPVDELGLRAAYSTSFRAPNPTETLSDLEATNVFIESGYPLPNGTNGTNGNVIYFGNQTLGPESSRNLTAGLDYQPIAAPGTRLSLNYYRIVYSNRLINAPEAENVFVNPQIYGPLIKQFGSDAAVESFVAGLEPPQTLIDYTNSGTGLAGVRYGFPYGFINAAQERTEGLDFGVHSLLSLAGNDKLLFDLNATYIRDINTTFCNSCVSTDLVNTYGQPLKFRARAAAGWSNGSFSTNAAVNFANAYADTNVVPIGRISSYTTADLNASWRLPSSNTTLGFGITNVFNADPPRTAPAFNGVAYDPTNADPRGRTLSLQVRQKW